MASSRPSSLILDDDDDWGAVSPLLTSTSRSSTTTSSSGKLLNYVTVGAALSGGGSKRNVWVREDGLNECLGKVGINNKFCVKLCEPGKHHCGTGRHASKFLVGTNVAYIRFTENQVHCTPVLPLDSLTQAQQGKVRSMLLTAAEWETVLGEIQSGHVPDWLLGLDAVKEEDEERSADADSLQLLSPMASRGKEGMFSIVPTFSFDSTSLEELDEGMETKVDDTDTRLLKVEGRLISLKSKLTRPFLDIEANYSVISSDISKLYDKVKSLTIAIGPAQRFEVVNAAVKSLTIKVTQLEEFKSDTLTRYNRVMSALDEVKENVNATMEEMTEQQAVASQFEVWMSQTDKVLSTFGKRFAAIKPILQKLSITSKNPDEDDYMQDPISGTGVSQLKVESLNVEESLICRLADLESKMKILENRVVGAGVQMGSFVFQSFEDLLKWVQVKIPKGRFGLFVDGHSFLEFFTLSGHVDTEVGTAAFSHSIKAGFSTYVEAQLAMSFKNLFPAVFGKGGSSSMDDSECLPAITKGDKWNNGSTGVHHQLMRNMNDVSYQLDSSIKKVLKDHPEGRQLAIDCVTASKRFVIDLIAFMSQEYSTWQQRGFSKKDAWQIVCQIVRRIFEDLQSARISARNSQDLEDADFTTATFLYATLRCHGIMEGIVRHQFHAHPHVASVITRHLAANFVKPEDLEAKMTALATKVDSLYSKVDLLVNKEKEKFKADKDKSKLEKLKKGKHKNDSEDS
jgi:hypothetical protein